MCSMCCSTQCAAHGGQRVRAVMPGGASPLPVTISVPACYSSFSRRFSVVRLSLQCRSISLVATLGRAFCRERNRITGIVQQRGAIADPMH